ncbi:MAG: DnaB-like helicase N-terminal domain-containing protein, partial [Campylobacterales bacterium]|nr:DnaB-like helicase N-terminal domain-containing protein [Campylobacterales bacterium]
MESLHNLNIERSILSSIFFNPELLEETSSILKPKDFYLPAHRYIFNAMILCEQEDLPVDEEFVRKKLLQDGKFDEDVMLEIIGTNPLPTIFAYANEIK